MNSSEARYAHTGYQGVTSLYAPPKIRTSNRAFWLFLAFLLIWSFLTQAPDVHALAFAHSDLTFSDLLIEPETGTAILLGQWQTVAYAEAKNSIGEELNQFDSHYGEYALANAMVTWAKGHAVIDAEYLTLKWVLADSDVNLPSGEPKAANSLGRGSFYNWFKIDGGTGPVAVNFSGKLSGNLSIETDAYGLLAKAEAIFGLELDGNNILDYYVAPSIGPNEHPDPWVISEPLKRTVSLNFNTPYFLWVEVDSETEGINVPEPTTGILLLAGLCTLVVVSIRKYVGGVSGRA